MNIPIGLLGGEGAKDYTTELFHKDIALFEKHFQNKPLWFMTSDYSYSAELKQSIFNEQVNMLNPTFIYKDDDPFKSEKGSIISIQLHEESKPNFESLSKLLNSHKFMSIEENIFGYSMKSKKMPE
jgi:uncharacterized protein with ATP-grasp and redox domains